MSPDASEKQCVALRRKAAALLPSFARYAGGGEHASVGSVLLRESRRRMSQGIRVPLT
jgi:hypothetical protein